MRPLHGSGAHRGVAHWVLEPKQNSERSHRAQREDVRWRNPGPSDAGLCRLAGEGRDRQSPDLADEDRDRARHLGQALQEDGRPVQDTTNPHGEALHKRVLRACVHRYADPGAAGETDLRALRVAHHARRTASAPVEAQPVGFQQTSALAGVAPVSEPRQLDRCPAQESLGALRPLQGPPERAPQVQRPSPPRQAV